MKEQGSNKRNNHYITYKGETHTISEWSKIKGIKEKTLWMRIKSGWEPERALTENVHIRGSNCECNSECKKRRIL